MNRIITILVTIFILLLLYIWISHVWGNDKPKHPKQIVDARETDFSDDLIADADTTYHAPAAKDTMMSSEETEDEFATERKTLTNTETKTTTPARPPVTEEKKVVEKKPEVKKPEPAPKKEVAPPPVEKKSTPATVKTETKPAATPTNMTGMHLVIAGNFAQLGNAQQQVQVLKKAGYADAEVVNFDLSEYHTVCAGRFADVNEARKLVKKLKDYHKIDAYVRIGG